MKRIILCLLMFIFLSSFETAYAEKKWWRKWPEFPKGLRITEQGLLELQRAGAKMVFVYAGYELGEGDEVVCGSLIIPFGKVPPYADGSTIKVRIPKDWWILCY